MSKLLIDDYPIQVLPKLAEEIGLNEAIVLQQMHYWLNTSKHQHNGKKWIYNSYTSWHEQFKFWSERTIKRIIYNLEGQDLLLTGNYNKYAFDRTKWYTINYEKLNNIMAQPSGQNDTTQSDNVSRLDSDNMTQPIPETTPETSTETTNNSATKVTQEQFEQWWNLYDKKLDKKKAFSLFKSALKKHDFEKIMNGTKDYLKTITDKQFQKYPKTFLSQESYMNDYKQERTVKTQNENNNSLFDQLMNGEG
ncbi:replication protein [Staphylococcus gallinarum]|uniref:replication protein n=1 Tax=Staphylococcus gallinarum TaxID=1293 RepID=UPI003170C25B